MAASSISIDMNDKKQVYRRHGVKEYLVWQVFDQKIDCFYLESGRYMNLQTNDLGIIKSSIFPGLWLAVNELLSGNMQQVLQVLQTGLESEEHQQFIQPLTD